MKDPATLIPGFARFETWLEGWPDALLSIACVAGGALLIALGLVGRPGAKAVALAYVIFP